MTRQERTKSGTGIYHVMLRGINRQDIFEDAEDYLQMVACLRMTHGVCPPVILTLIIIYILQLIKELLIL